MPLSTLMTLDLSFCPKLHNRIFPCALSIDVNCKLCKPSWLTSHRGSASVVPLFLFFDGARQRTATCKSRDKNTLESLTGFLLLKMQILLNFSCVPYFAFNPPSKVLIMHEYIVISVLCSQYHNL